MAQDRTTPSFQKLGNGDYRVSGTVRRSAVTGRYVTSRKPGAKSNAQPARAASRRSS